MTHEQSLAFIADMVAGSGYLQRHYLECWEKYEQQAARRPPRKKITAEERKQYDRDRQRRRRAVQTTAMEPAHGEL